MKTCFSKHPLPSVAKDGSLHVTDDVYTTLTSAFGTLFFLIASFFLISRSLQAQKFWHVVSFSIYGFTATFLFLASALHHAIDGSRKTNLFLLRLDYCAIYLMIAGSATPLCLILIHNTLGFILLSLFWILAGVGIITTVLCPVLPRWLTICIYLGISWLGLLMLYPIYQHIGKGLALLILGGLFYTVGAVLYYLQIPNPYPKKFGFHEIWHLLVLGGAISHLSVLWFFLLKTEL